MDIVRMWKDPEYREGLSADEVAGAPEHPAGLARLSSSEIERLAGAGTERTFTFGCCQPWMTITTVTPINCYISINFCPG